MKELHQEVITLDSDYEEQVQNFAEKLLTGFLPSPGNENGQKKVRKTLSYIGGSLSQEQPSFVDPGAEISKASCEKVDAKKDEADPDFEASLD